ncbi:hypothetical protein L7F22_027662 [Adiantum nelumboides]|nr:hypothetical protein [Adiantum nelumboides]
MAMYNLKGCMVLFVPFEDPCGRLADGCSEGLRCVFSALNCVKLQRGPSEHPSTSRIAIRLALELTGKPYDLPASSNTNRLTIRLANGYSKDPCCVFSALDGYPKRIQTSSSLGSIQAVEQTSCAELQLWSIQVLPRPPDSYLQVGFFLDMPPKAISTRKTSKATSKQTVSTRRINKDVATLEPTVVPIEEENVGNHEENVQDEIEAQLQIMPYVVRMENAQPQDHVDESSMGMFEGEDILAKTRILSCFECPQIPLCRFLPYAKVRGLRDDLSGLKVGFGKEGYVPEKGVFIVSLCTFLGECTLVSDAILESWDPFWVEINKEFEEELKEDPALSILSNHMFYVWEGNHRTVAWLEAIQERFFERKEKHVRVLSTIIDPRKVNEISLLSCFQRMNFLNTHALVATSLRDELVNTCNICTSNSQDYLKELPHEDVALIDKIQKKQTKGDEPWFPLTRKFLAKLVYNIHMHSELQKELDPLRVKLLSHELKQVETKKQNELVRKYSDRIGKILNIVDLKLGEEWWKKVLSLKWSGESFATIEKLNVLAMCNNIPNSTRVLWLLLLEANKVTKAVYAVPRLDYDFRRPARRSSDTPWSLHICIL